MKVSHVLYNEEKIFQLVEVIHTQGTSMFSAMDIGNCINFTEKEVLEYMTERHIKNPAINKFNDTYITEHGVNRLIMINYKKPVIRAFQKWFCEEVSPVSEFFNKHCFIATY